MTFIYGAEYTQYSWLLIGYSLVYLFILLGFPLRICLRSLENTKHIFYAYFTTGLLSVFCSKYVVILWGLQGVMGGIITLNIIMVTMLVIFAKYSAARYKIHPSI